MGVEVARSQIGVAIMELPPIVKTESSDMLCVGVEAIGVQVPRGMRTGVGGTEGMELPSVVNRESADMLCASAEKTLASYSSRPSILTSASDSVVDKASKTVA